MRPDTSPGHLPGYGHKNEIGGLKARCHFVDWWPEAMDRAFSPQTVSMSEFLGLYLRLEWGRADGPRTNSSHSSSVEPFKAWAVGPQTNRACGPVRTGSQRGGQSGSMILTGLQRSNRTGSAAGFCQAKEYVRSGFLSVDVRKFFAFAILLVKGGTNPPLNGINENLWNKLLQTV